MTTREMILKFEILQVRYTVIIQEETSGHNFYPDTVEIVSNVIKKNFYKWAGYDR